MEIAEMDAGGAILRRFVPGGAIDSRVAMLEGAGTADIRYYHADRLGNVAAMSDGTGRISERYAYDPFGNECALDANGTCVAGPPSASGNPFRYTGRRYDPETGLYFYRARYYDAKLGRFLSTDPIGYEDQWNLYAYVGNNPLNATDPSGMCGSPITGFESCKVLANSIVNATNEVIEAVGTALTGQDCCVPDIPTPFPDTNPAVQNIVDGVVVTAAEVAGVVASRGSSTRATKPDLTDPRLQSGARADRNGLTSAGRALQKHGDRENSVFPQSSGNAAARNQQGQDVLSGILESSNQTTRANRQGGVDIFDQDTGRGARFNENDEFTGFLEP